MSLMNKFILLNGCFKMDLKNQVAPQGMMKQKDPKDP